MVRSLANPLTGITTTNGNIAMCAARDIILDNTFNAAALITLTEGMPPSATNLGNLGVARGLTLNAGNGGTGPGPLEGTLRISPGTSNTVSGAVGDSPINIFYNPTTYLTPTDFSGFFTGDGNNPVVSRMLVFPEVTKNFDGGTTAVPTSLKGNPANVTLIAGPGAIATFENATAGTNKIVTFSGYTLGGPDANRFALPSNCCSPIVQKTTGTIRPAVVPVVIPGVIPVVVPGASSTFPYIGLAAPALATFALYQPGLVPTFASDAGNVFFAIKEEEVVRPTPIPFISPPPPYVAPRYVPKPARN